jgi:hypothetical protein
MEGIDLPVISHGRRIVGCVRMFLGILVGASLEVCFPHYSNGVDDSQDKTKLKIP